MCPFVGCVGRLPELLRRNEVRDGLCGCPVARATAPIACLAAASIRRLGIYYVVGQVHAKDAEGRRRRVPGVQASGYACVPAGGGTKWTVAVTSRKRP
jgi:hypothetical protein